MRHLKQRFLGLLAIEKLRARQCSRISATQAVNSKSKIFFLRINGRRKKNFIRSLETGGAGYLLCCPWQQQLLSPTGSGIARSVMGEDFSKATHCPLYSLSWPSIPSAEFLTWQHNKVFTPQCMQDRSAKIPVIR